MQTALRTGGPSPMWPLLYSLREMNKEVVQPAALSNPLRHHNRRKDSIVPTGFVHIAKIGVVSCILQSPRGFER